MATDYTRSVRGCPMKYTLVYGSIVGAIVIVAIVVTSALSLPGHATSEWFGYLVMLMAMSLIFVGVKRFRDFECGGVIGFGRALALGVGIAAVAGVIYVVGWEIYLALSGRDFMGEYSKGIIDAMRAKGATASTIAAKQAEMRSFAEMYRNPVMRLPLTFIEIFPVGLLVALISAGLLRDPARFPAQAR